MATVATEHAPRPEDVEAWLESVRGDLRRVEASIEPLIQKQTRLRDRELLLVKLLQSLSGKDLASAPPAEITAAEAQSTARAEGSTLEYVRSCVLDILREKGGGPMHINDIHAKFLSKGFRVPGAGRPANLTAHLGRCPGITSPTRGFYAIGERSASRPSPRGRRARSRA